MKYGENPGMNPQQVDREKMKVVDEIMLNFANMELAELDKFIEADSEGDLIGAIESRFQGFSLLDQDLATGLLGDIRKRYLQKEQHEWLEAARSEMLYILKNLSEGEVVRLKKGYERNEGSREEFIKKLLGFDLNLKCLSKENQAEIKRTFVSIIEEAQGYFKRRRELIAEYERDIRSGRIAFVAYGLLNYVGNNSNIHELYREEMDHIVRSSEEANLLLSQEDIGHLAEILSAQSEKARRYLDDIMENLYKIYIKNGKEFVSNRLFKWEKICDNDEEFKDFLLKNHIVDKSQLNSPYFSLIKKEILNSDDRLDSNNVRQIIAILEFRKAFDNFLESPSRGSIQELSTKWKTLDTKGQEQLLLKVTGFDENLLRYKWQSGEHDPSIYGLNWNLIDSYVTSKLPKAQKKIPDNMMEEIAEELKKPEYAYRAPDNDARRAMATQIAIFHGFKEIAPEMEAAERMVRVNGNAPILQYIKENKNDVRKRQDDVRVYYAPGTYSVNGIQWPFDAIDVQNIMKLQAMEKIDMSKANAYGISEEHYKKVLTSLSCYLVTRAVVLQQVDSDNKPLPGGPRLSTIYGNTYPKLASEVYLGTEGTEDFKYFCDGVVWDKVRREGVATLKADRKNELKEKFKAILSLQMLVASENEEAFVIQGPNAFLIALSKEAKKEAVEMFTEAVIEIITDLDNKRKYPGLKGIFVNSTPNMLPSLGNAVNLALTAKKTTVPVAVNPGDSASPALIAEKYKVNVAEGINRDGTGAWGNGAQGPKG